MAHALLFGAGMSHRMLLVDDEETILLQLREYFEGHGFSVDCAGSVEEAEGLLGEVPYAVALTDLNLNGGGLEGFDVLRLVKQQRPETPTVVLTCNESPQVEREALALGAAAVLHKPQRLKELHCRVRSLLGGDCVIEPDAGPTRAQAPRLGSEALYRALVETSLDGVTLLDAEGRIQYLSASGTRILGYETDDVVGRVAFDFVHPEDRAQVADRLQKLLARPATRLEHEFRVRHKDGRWLWVNCSGINRLTDPTIRAIVNSFRDVSAHKEAEAAVRRTELLVRTMVEATPDVVFAKDGAGRYILANTAAARLAGKSIEDVLGRTDEEIQPADLGAACKASDAEVAGSEAPRTFEETGTFEGQTRTFLTVKGLLRDETGAPAGVFGISRDITSRKLAEEKLRASEERYRALFENNLAGCYVATPDGRILTCNPKFARIFGFASVQEAMAAGIAARYVALGDRQTLLEELEREGRVEFRRAAMRRQDGQPVHVVISAVGRNDEAGRLARIEGMLWDETPAAIESARLLGELREKEARLQLAIDASNLGPWDWDLRTNDVYFSPEWKRQIGHQEHEIQGRYEEWESRLHPEDREPTLAALRAYIDGRRPEYAVEFRLRHKDGSYRWIYTRGEMLRGADGKPSRMLGCHIDITERKRGEQERSRLAMIVAQSAEAVLITDPRGDIVYVNAAFERLSGYSRAEVLGKNPRLLKSGRHDATFYERLWSTLAKGEVWHGRIVNRRKDGAFYEEEATISAVRDASGAIVNYVGLGRDVTHERRLEEQLRQSQKMEAVGQLAGGVAHDFNNLLGVITGYSELALKSMAEGDPSRARLEQIRKAADRAAALTRQLLAFSRRQVLQPKVLDLNSVVGDMQKMLRRLIGEDVDLVTVAGPSLGTVKADPGQIEQVVMNLVVNARDAMPDGGRLTIETSNVDLDAAYIAQHPVVDPGRYVMLAVSDTGCGMDEETRAHVFEPFFTTKELGKGTGLGLSTVYGIVKQSGGYIWVYSEVGHGTTFKIYLPRADEPLEKDEALAHSPLARGTETVLLVEDEAALRELIRETLESNGYTVLVAGKADDAAAIVGAHEGQVHLLLTDVIMPGMNGRSVADRMVALRPGIGVLYVSGYTDSAILRHGVLEPGVAFLAKPFTTDALLRKVREVLEAQRPEPGVP